MEWEKIFPTLTKKVYTAVVKCLRNYRTEAATQLTTIKEDGHAKIYTEMSKRFRQFEWFVLDLPSSGLVSNTKVDLIHTQDWICLQHNRGRHYYVVKARWWHDFVLTTPPELRRL